MRGPCAVMLPLMRYLVYNAVALVKSAFELKTSYSTKRWKTSRKLVARPCI